MHRWHELLGVSFCRLGINGSEKLNNYAKNIWLVTIDCLSFCSFSTCHCLHQCYQLPLCCWNQWALFRSLSPNTFFLKALIVPWLSWHHTPLVWCSQNTPSHCCWLAHPTLLDLRCWSYPGMPPLPSLLFILQRGVSRTPLALIVSLGQLRRYIPAWMAHALLKLHKPKAQLTVCSLSL